MLELGQILFEHLTLLSMRQYMFGSVQIVQHQILAGKPWLALRRFSTNNNMRYIALLLLVAFALA